ncbi:putative ATP-grasp superfamily ATP-dependent carboligase [Saccharopolyspora lacisalsi]|uniref:Putative ATP-grasp superfamily ATP-dependent carboligase n=1 Tax=Halosaccharopolyspora lacisalsi TaxID=1000566 RepID=A0A839DTY1_9PSEU|nr:carboxylate--amine ligase [Halosaccharopolyspora lacisalsi]MBA8824380.1 putative ATP-grasp superfamily ATP-dependent carboligase [Halosaccharopolyspora lacisalsi]
MTDSAMRPVRTTELDTTTPAVVLKLDPNVFHHGGLGVVRSLGRLGVPVYTVHEDPLAPAAHSRYLHGRWLWSPDPEETDRLLEGLQRLAEHIGRPAVLLPTDDAGAIFVAEQAARLRRWFLFAAPDPELPRRLAGKSSMYELCRTVGFPHPRGVRAETWNQARDFAARTGFPLVAKLATPWRSAGQGVRSTTIVETEQGLCELYRACGRAGLVLQEFITGDGDWFFHGYCGTDGACLSAHTGVKERSYPARAGLTSLGRSVVNTELRDRVTELLGRLSYRGTVDIDLRWDQRDRSYKLLDFNPRLGAQFRLFRDEAGIDVVRAAYLDLTGQRVAAGGAVAERRFLVENYDPLAAWRYWRRGEIGLRSWAASLRGVDEVAWLASDDLLPFGLMCLRMSWRALSGPRRGRSTPQQPRYRAGRAAGNRRHGHNARHDVSLQPVGEDQP